MSKRTMAQQFGSEIVDFSCNQMIRDGRFLQGNLVLEFSDGSKARIPASGFYNQNPGTWDNGYPEISGLRQDGSLEDPASDRATGSTAG